MRIPLCLLLILTLLHSATITGSIYSSDSFEKVNGTVLKFEGKSSYQIISEYGDYSVTLEPGEYNITATKVEEGKLRYYSRDKITAGEKNQTFDVVLFDPAWFESGELPDLDVEIPPKSSDDTPIIIAGALVLAAALFILVRKYMKFENFPEKKNELGEDEMRVLRIIKGNEGRMEQKQLRGILKFSESKMSLLLTELEVTGCIKRFKKGRENIIKLKKEA